MLSIDQLFFAKFKILQLIIRNTKEIQDTFHVTFKHEDIVSKYYNSYYFSFNIIISGEFNFCAAFSIKCVSEILRTWSHHI